MVDIKDLVKGLNTEKSSTMSTEDIIKLIELLNSSNKGLNFETLFGYALLKDMLKKDENDSLKKEIEELRKELVELKNPQNNLMQTFMQFYMLKQLSGNSDSALKDFYNLLLSQQQSNQQVVQNLYEKMLSDTKERLEKEKEEKEKLLERFEEMRSELENKILELQQQVIDAVQSKKTNFEEFIERLNELRQMEKKFREFIREAQLESEPLVKEGRINIEKLIDTVGRFISFLQGSSQPQASPQVAPPQLEVKPPEEQKPPETQVSEQKEIPKAPVITSDTIQSSSNKGEIVENPPTES